jgi:lipopolysaccharide export system permease protein
MRVGSVIHRYIFRELISPFVISLAFLMFVFLMTELIDITDLVVNYQVGFSTVLMMLAYSIPSFMQFIIPMSTMIAVLLAFLKMSSDNEIVALKAGGMSVYAMLPPVIIFCLLGCLIAGSMSVYGEPWGRRSTKAITRKLSKASMAAFLKERTFNTKFSGRMLYFSKIDARQNTLEGIFMEDSSMSDQAITITAPRGRLLEEGNSYVYRLQLEDGQANRVDVETGDVSVDTFKTASFLIDLRQAMKSSDDRKKGKEMYIGELREHIRSYEKKNDRYYEALISLHKKFSLPFACFAMGILGVPLGIQSKSARRSFGIGLGFFFFLGYYLVMSAGEVYGRTGYYPPAIGMWAPNIVMGGIGCILLVRCARERAIGIGWFLHLLRFRSGPNTGKSSSATHNP